MGIIRAAVNAVHGSLADQWLETVEPYEMGEHTVFTEGILVRKGQNKKGSQTISNGSVIHVYDNQFMMLVARIQQAGAECSEPPRLCQTGRCSADRLTRQ